MSLITPFEVLKYSPAGMAYPTNQFCELIPDIELELARECLTVELYEYLEARLAPYPTTAAEFDNCTAYNIGQKVIRNGCLFVSVINNNETDPLGETGAWTAFLRFTNVWAQKLWVEHLRRLIALKVYSASLLYSTWQTTGGGLTIQIGDGSGFAQGHRAANKGEIAHTHANLATDIERKTANMLYWIKKNASVTGFPNSAVCSDICQPTGRRSRRWMLKY